MSHGVLLTNLGTPKNKDLFHVGQYLCEFLTDKRVIPIPALFRYLLVYGLIVPFRVKKSAQAYHLIWSEKGSPLLAHSKDQVVQLQKSLHEECKIALGMRYGSPSIAEALQELKGCTSITLLPLYPQYSSATTGSTLEETLRLLGAQNQIPSLTVIRDFYRHPSYIQAQARLIKTHLKEGEHLLVGYHGIPEYQVKQGGCKTICSNECPSISSKNQDCYKAQCYETTRLLAAELKLPSDQYSSSFQSRLGRMAWIKPYTDEVLIQLSEKKIKNLTVVCPSFVTDCLETLEEIGIRAKEQWHQLGGERLTVVPCLNSDPLWIKAIKDLCNLGRDE